MKYYIQIKDNQILSFSNLPVSDIDIKNEEVTEEVFNEFKEHPNYYYVENNQLIRKTDEQIAQEQSQAEKERIQKLNMTKLDFVNCLETKGVTYEAVRVVLDSNYEAKKQWDLCERVYRFNPLLDSMCSQFGITPQDLDDMFIAKGVQ